MPNAIATLNKKCATLASIKKKIDEIEAQKQLLWDQWVPLRADLATSLTENQLRQWKYDDPKSDKFMTVSVRVYKKPYVTSEQALITFLKKTDGLKGFVHETYTSDFLRNALKVADNNDVPGLEVEERESISIQFPKKPEAKKNDSQDTVNKEPF